MKFLCVPCDKPMRLEQTAADDKGSISLRYVCDECGYEMAMLTNPFETQLVSSLGVQVGPGRSAAGAAAAPAGRCPFTGVVQAIGAHDPAAAPAAAEHEPSVAWTAEARERLSQLPDFVRPMAKTGIEKWAQDKGYGEVDARVLDEARDFFGM